MSNHASLTGSDLHESKGIATAASGTVYVANGAGSGSFISWFQQNKTTFSLFFDDIGTAKTIYFVVPFNCTVSTVYSVIEATNTTTATNLTIKNSAGSAMTGGTITHTAGGIAGEVKSATTTTNNTFTAGQVIQITSDGGSTTVTPAMITIVATITS